MVLDRNNMLEWAILVDRNIEYERAKVNERNNTCE